VCTILAPTRRTLATGLGTAALATGAAQAAGRRKATFILVHGAWHGGWCWRDVRPLLEARGHCVFTPTLTGLGERAHLRDPVPRLAMHIADVLGLIKAEELHDIVLVGHSYGGMVITGVADAVNDSIRRLVYLDAAVPSDGQSMITQSPGITPDQAAQSEASLRGLTQDGLWMSALAPQAFGIPPENTAAIDWAKRRLTPHPLPTWTDPIALRNDPSEGPPRTYILCNQPLLPQASFAAHHARIVAGQAGTGWTAGTLATGHDAMVTAPRETARLLLQAAQ
jgi:pimeloyl-ACP methyl ester carboxylesterase